jgi:AcrR family transcriptional regulator
MRHENETFQAMTNRTTARSSDTRAEIKAAVLRHAREHPEDGQQAAARALGQSGMTVSPAGVRYIWVKHGLETAYKRLRALERQLGGVESMTQSQRDILRRGEATRRLVRRSRLAADGADAMPPDERRNQIMLAAAELFVKRGYAGTSIRDIAERVGLLAGSVYHHFRSKEEILLAVNHEGFRQLTARVRQIVVESRTARDRLEAACAAHVEAVVGGDPIARITATALFAIHEEKLQRRMQQDREAYDRLFRELIDALDLPEAIDRSVFRLALFGALNWTRLWYRPGRMTPSDIGRQIAAIVDVPRT